MFTSFTADSLIKSLSKYDTVSFDVFDTLIRRCFAFPRDVFAGTARDFSDAYIDPEKFLHDRRTAQRSAYDSLKADSHGREEVTLDQIYDRLPSEYAGIRDKLKALEIQREVKCCRPDPVIHKVYEWCRENHKRIFIISDMYLSEEIVSEILASCGYSCYEKLYMSSEIGLRKKTGNLFRHFIRDSGINPKNHIHIGDSFRSDFLGAIRAGLHSRWITRHPNRSSYTKTRGLKPEFREQYEKYQTVINYMTSPDSNSYYQYGFEVIGMMLYGLTCWLHERFTERKHEHIFFIARDGYIMREAYNILFGDKAVSNSYLYASRNSLIFPRICMFPELGDVFESVTPFELFGLSYVCDVLHISDTARARAVWRECGFGDDERMSKKQFLSDDRAGKFFEAFREDICRESKKSFDLAAKYLRQEGFCGNAAIVDIGWACTMQKYLAELVSAAGIDAEIFGCYLGVKPKTLASGNFESYIPSELKPSSFCPAMMEYPFTKIEGSAKSYEADESGNIIPILYDYEFSGTPDEEYTRQIQKGALDFIALMRDGYGFEHIDYSVAYAKLRKVSKFPSLRDAKLLGGLRYVNHGIMSYLASPKSFLHYLIHPRGFKTDFQAGGWKAGFLRRVFKLPLPYDSAMSFARKILSRKYS